MDGLHKLPLKSLDPLFQLNVRVYQLEILCFSQLVSPLQSQLLHLFLKVALEANLIFACFFNQLPAFDGSVLSFYCLFQYFHKFLLLQRVFLRVDFGLRTNAFDKKTSRGLLVFILPAL